MRPLWADGWRPSLLGWLLWGLWLGLAFTGAPIIIIGGLLDEDEPDATAQVPPLRADG